MDFPENIYTVFTQAFQSRVRLLLSRDTKSIRNMSNVRNNYRQVYFCVRISDFSQLVEICRSVVKNKNWMSYVKSDLRSVEQFKTIVAKMFSVWYMVPSGRIVNISTATKQTKYCTDACALIIFMKFLQLLLIIFLLRNPAHHHKCSFNFCQNNT